MILGRTRQIHLVAIGGIGMSGIAEILVNSGFRVSGSDLSESPALQRLRSLGISCHVGHRAEQVGEADVVVHSTAVPPDNPELQEARRRKIPVVRRGEMLAELMRLKHGIAVTGSHGKTTTSSLAAEILHAGQLEPTAVIGGRLHSIGSNALLGSGPYMVVEADESDGSFLRLAPTWAVVTNVDREHLDHYGSFEKLQEAFVDFLDRVPFYGASIVCLEDPVLRSLLPSVSGRIVGYGFGEDAALRGRLLEKSERGMRFAWESARNRGEAEIPLLGDHNLLNALAAVAVGLELSMEPEAIALGLSRFRGVGRRYDVKGEARGVFVIDDYAHHPTEITAILKALHEHSKRPVKAVFQPHRYSRTQILFDDFAAAFDLAEEVIITEIYEASEKPIEGITPEALVESVNRRGKTPALHLS
ncbi:MAG: UDP-N-acetylmuramate--L-alanine ligase, partial [Candidatus Krumholzibacteria bacterium]|nr:UDP-N-acetylmuramate--L-alanine ligase [Candidatus Krumholzibacteria bacterium]